MDNSTGNLNPYFQLAEQYTFGDRMFQTNQGPSFPAHQFIISGTSAPSSDSDLFAAENPARGTEIQEQYRVRCSFERIRQDDRSQRQRVDQMYPCFDHRTLVDYLDFRGISWRYYTPSAGSIWTGPNAIYHLRFGSDWDNDVVLKPPQVLTDIANGQLANVSWVIPDRTGIGPSQGQQRFGAFLGRLGCECHRQ